MPRLASRGIAFNGGPGDLDAGARHRSDCRSAYFRRNASSDLNYPDGALLAGEGRWLSHICGERGEGGIPRAAALPGDIRIGRSSNPTRRRHSDIIASFATAMMEFFKGSLRKHPTLS